MGADAVIDSSREDVGERLRELHGEGRVVGVHKTPVPIDLGALLAAEITLVTAMGYPDEFVDVAVEVAEHRDAFARIISDRFDHADVTTALTTAATPGAADKIVVTLP